MNINQKLKFLALLITSSVVLAGSITIFLLTQLEHKTEFIKSGAGRQMRSSGTMILAAVQVQQWLTDISATRGAEGFDDGFAEAKKWAANFRHESVYLRSVIAGHSALLQQQNAIDQAFEAYYKMGQEMAHIYIDKGPVAGNVFMGKFDPYAEKIQTLLQRHDKQVSQLLEHRFSDIYAYIDMFHSVVIALVIGVSLFTLIALTWLNASIQKALKYVANGLSDAYQALSRNAHTMADSSRQLHNSVEDQATSFEQTSTAIEEISATVEHNAAASKNSSQLTNDTVITLKKGLITVEEMSQIVSAIEQGNRDIANHLKTSNQEIESIVSVINDIGHKTQMINDIVFQTKLLSFNASVEAARAGEHGQGFAVVAEEIGNLATMSGKSANEISTIVSSSIEKVSKIVTETQGRMNSLMKLGEERIHQGREKSSQVGVVFNDIMTRSNNVSRHVDEISQASNEQALGVREVNKAILNLKGVTQNSNKVANDNAEVSEDIQLNANQIKDAISELEKLVGIAS